jgi:site-specific recombinase XerD
MKDKIDKYIKSVGGVFFVRVTTSVRGINRDRKAGPFDSKGDARNVVRKFLTERDELKMKVKLGQNLWTDAVEEYIKWMKASSGFAGATIHSYELILRKYQPVWSNKITNEIGPDDVLSLVEIHCSGLQDEGKKTVVKALRNVFSHQIKLKRLHANPCAGLFTTKSEKELVAMSRKEIEHLLREARKQNHPWHLIWRVVYGLGLRSGEGFALKWSDIKWEDDTVSINKAYCFKTKKIGPTKNKKIRAVDLDPELKKSLLEAMKVSDSDFVLPRMPEWGQGKAAWVLRQFQKQIGILETNFHSLRASFITHLLLRGVPVPTVQKLVGHSSLATTQKYVRLTGSDTKGATHVLAIDDSEPSSGE